MMRGFTSVGGPFGLRRWPRRYFLDAVLGVLVVIGIVFRFVALDHIPGINGDEAYLGTKVLLWRAGETVSLRTGTNLLPDPISLLLSRLLLSAFGNSWWTLRLTTALTGVATIGVVYALARRHLGRHVALTCAAITAALPTHIVYSRFFWEPSQSPLVCALWMWAAMAKRPILTGALGTLAVIVHPTNAFLAPIVAWPHYRRFRFWYNSRRYHDRAPSSPLTLLRLFVLVAAAISALFVLVMLYQGHSRVDDAVKSVIGRVTNAKSFGDFLTHYPGLFTGTTVYSYIVGTPEPRVTQLHLAAFLICFVLPVLVSLVIDRRRVGGQCFALAASALAFYALAGADALVPNSERYVLWMTVPHCVLAVTAWEHLAERLYSPNLGKAAIALVCSLMLGAFVSQYFRRIQVQNSTSELSFATGAVEPKQQAFEQILTSRRPSERIRIYAEDWWTYWAMKFLSLGHSPSIEVTIFGSGWDRRFPLDFMLPSSPPALTRSFYVGYPRSDFVRRVAAEHADATHSVIHGYGDKPVLELFSEPSRN